MNENQNNVQNNEDEIDMRELVMALWKQKVMIISITLIVAILAGVYSVFLISPVYDTKLNIVISMPETYNTRYGSYTLPITTNQQYIALITSNDVLENTIKDMGPSLDAMTIDDLKKEISIGKINTAADVVQNNYDVTVSARNAKDSLKLAETLYDNYAEFLDTMTKERAAIYFYNNYSVSLESMEVSLKSTNEILLKNKELLAKTPQTINQKEAMIAIKGQLTNTSDYVVLENIINENYTKIESDIVANEQSIDSMEESMSVYKGYLADLEKEKKAIADYHKTGREVKLNSDMIGVVETSVYLPSQPVAPTRKTSPSNSMNVLIGAVIGGMIGILITLVKKYWFKELPLADKVAHTK